MIHAYVQTASFSTVMENESLEEERTVGGVCGEIVDVLDKVRQMEEQMGKLETFNAERRYIHVYEQHAVQYNH